MIRSSSFTPNTRCKNDEYCGRKQSSFVTEYPQRKEQDPRSELNYSTVSVTLGVDAIEEVEHFTHLGSFADIQGETEDVKARIGKARVAFLQPHHIWKPSSLFQEH